MMQTEVMRSARCSTKLHVLCVHNMHRDSVSQTYQQRFVSWLIKRQEYAIRVREHTLDRSN